MKSILCFIGVLLGILALSCKKEYAHTGTFNLDEPQMTDTGIYLHWTNPHIEGLICYQILRSVDDGKNFDIIQTFRSGLQHTSFLDFKYPYNTKVTYKVAILSNSIDISNCVDTGSPDPVKLDFMPTDGIIPEPGKILFYSEKGDTDYLCLYDAVKNEVLYQANFPVRSADFKFGLNRYKENYPAYVKNGLDFDQQIAAAFGYQHNPLFDIPSGCKYVFSDKYFILSSMPHIIVVNPETLTRTVYTCDISIDMVQFLYYVSSINSLIGITLQKTLIFPMDQSGTITGQSVRLNDTYYNMEGTNYIYRIFDSHFINLLTGEEGIFPFPLNYYRVENGIIFAENGWEIDCYAADDLSFIMKIPVVTGPELFLSDGTTIYLIYGSRIIQKVPITD